MRIWARAIILAVLAAFFGGAATTQADARTPEAIIAAARTKGLRDGTVLVAVGGRPVFHGAFGYANREWRVPTRGPVVYRVGSITKSFTAAAILQLAEQGKLSLGDPVSKFISGAPTAWSGVTLQQLLTHTSGIPDFTQVLGDAIDTWIGRDPREVVSVLRDRPLDFEPGSRFAYDNTGYVLLGLVVERVSGEPLEVYLRRHVFQPLGMCHTGFVSENVLSDRAYGYRREHGRWRDTAWMSNVRASGAGALYATADDLLAWDRALNSGKVIGARSEALMFHDYGHAYGLGFATEVVAGHRTWWHNGHVDGFGAALYRAPDVGVTVIVLSNDDDAPVEDVGKALLAHFARARANSSPPARTGR